MLIHEFDIIQNFFSQQKKIRDDVILGIGDDAAIVQVPADKELAITCDTLVNKVHFLENTHAADIGYKALAVNLSDLAAMGATPAWFTLSLTLPEANPKWLSDFSQGLFELAQTYQTQLIGGDLTQGPLSITIQAMGLLPKNSALCRHKAKPGDLIYVTHTVGDAALALELLTKPFFIAKEFHDPVIQHLNRPEPRIHIGEKIRTLASAAIDISDGLAADLRHILKQSGVGAEINIDQIPLSPALKSLPQDLALKFALTGGDDYELCFTIQPEKINLLTCNCTCIGKITTQLGLNLQHENGKKYNGNIEGYQHF